MNSTASNNASFSTWNGIRAPWIGTKNIWDLFIATGLFDNDIYNEIKYKKGKDWNEDFVE